MKTEGLEKEMSYSLDAMNAPEDILSSSNRRRAGPTTPQHKFCDVYLDIAMSYYTQWGVGTTTVSVLADCMRCSLS
jgi:hypothetical protein